MAIDLRILSKISVEVWKPSVTVWSHQIVKCRRVTRRTGSDFTSYRPFWGSYVPSTRLSEVTLLIGVGLFNGRGKNKQDYGLKIG